MARGKTSLLDVSTSTLLLLFAIYQWESSYVAYAL